MYENRTPLVNASAVIDEVQVPYGALNGLIAGYGIYTRVRMNKMPVKSLYDPWKYRVNHS